MRWKDTVKRHERERLYEGLSRQTGLRTRLIPQPRCRDKLVTVPRGFVHTPTNKGF